MSPFNPFEFYDLRKVYVKALIVYILNIPQKFNARLGPRSEFKRHCRDEYLNLLLVI